MIKHFTIPRELVDQVDDMTVTLKIPLKDDNKEFYVFLDRKFVDNLNNTTDLDFVWFDTGEPLNNRLVEPGQEVKRNSPKLPNLTTEQLLELIEHRKDLVEIQNECNNPERFTSSIDPDLVIKTSVRNQRDYLKEGQIKRETGEDKKVFYCTILMNVQDAQHNARNRFAINTTTDLVDIDLENKKVQFTGKSYETVRVSFIKKEFLPDPPTIAVLDPAKIAEQTGKSAEEIMTHTFIYIKDLQRLLENPDELQKELDAGEKRAEKTKEFLKAKNEEKKKQWLEDRDDR